MLGPLGLSVNALEGWASVGVSFVYAPFSDL